MAESKRPPGAGSPADAAHACLTAAGLYETLMPERERVARACRVMGKLDLTRSTFGHISLRVPDHDLILIRARGPGESGIRYTSADDIILVDLDGRKVAGRDDLHVPKEVFIHTALLKARPALGSVLHAHPSTVVLFSICGVPLLPLVGAFDPSCLRLVNDGIANYPRSVLIHNEELGRDLASVMREARSCVMRGHGVTTLGATVEDAVLDAIRLNDLADLNYRARLLGTPEPIAQEDMAFFEQVDVGGNDPYWRYYCRLTGEN